MNSSRLPDGEHRLPVAQAHRVDPFDLIRSAGIVYHDNVFAFRDRLRDDAALLKFDCTVDTAAARVR
jgi:hypothetical protein